MILDDIIASTKIRVEKAKEQKPYTELIKEIDNQSFKTNSFKNALTDYDGIAIIGEIKKASPSKGIIRSDFNHIEIAKEYSISDIQALSILTEPQYFKGDISFLKDIKNIVNLPLLRKDFIISEYQIYEAKYFGADAILLIMAALSDKEFNILYKCAKELKLDCLVETHNKEEVLRAVEYADIIGINNRNLYTFEENLKTCEELINYIPKNKVIVAESAIRTHEDYKYLNSLNIDAMLIGEAFMREDSVSSAVRELRCGV